MNDVVLPEDKLLRLIRQPKMRLAVEALAEDIALPGAGKPGLSKSSLSFSRRYSPFLSLSKAMRVLFWSGAVCLFISIIYPMAGLTKIKLSPAAQEKIIAPELNAAKRIQPPEASFPLLKSRSLFESRAPEAKEDPAGRVDTDLFAGISLVGIIAGESPQAIVEDKKSQKTYYLSKGQLMGEIKIADIKDGRIILNYKDQNYDLYL